MTVNGVNQGIDYKNALVTTAETSFQILVVAVCDEKCSCSELFQLFIRVLLLEAKFLILTDGMALNNNEADEL